MSLLLFDKRHKLGKEFEKWAKENNVLNCPESVITWLYGEGLLNTQRVVKKLGSDLPKLVRDKIPDLIKTSGKTPIFFANTERRYDLLLDKLQEEVNELEEAKTRPEKIEEACDIFEVIIGILDELSPNVDWYETLQKKRNEKGRFCGAYVLQRVEDKTDESNNDKH